MCILYTDLGDRYQTSYTDHNNCVKGHGAQMGGGGEVLLRFLPPTHRNKCYKMGPHQPPNVCDSLTSLVAFQAS